MSFTVADLTSRINEELKLYGAFESNTITNIIKNAVVEYMKKVDRPTISATLAVTSGATKYSLPTTIDQVEDIRDENGNSIVVTRVDTLGRVVYLQNAPSGAVNYSVYGTPRDIKTNLNTVVSAIDENDENVVWAFIEAYANKAAQGQEWVTLLQAANKAVVETLQSRNRSLSMSNTSMRFVDNNGQRIDDLNNADGVEPDITDYLASDY